MDILIKGMWKPSKCEECPLQKVSHDGEIVVIGCALLMEGSSSPCPLIPVPEHGDLIPYLAVKKAIVKYFGKDNTAWCDLMDEIDKIDVVVEGCRGSDN